MPPKAKSLILAAQKRPIHKPREDPKIIHSRISKRWIVQSRSSLISLGNVWLLRAKCTIDITASNSSILLLSTWELLYALELLSRMPWQESPAEFLDDWP
jgi:hypothetical protein